VHYLTRAQLDDEEREDRPEEDVVGLQQVAGPDLRGVVAQERRPAPAPRLGATGKAHVLLDGALAHPDAQLQKFAPEAFGAPKSVVDRHALD